MMTSETRDELRRIQAELKKPLAPELHEVREIPGGSKKWIFLPWQIIRERLDEVTPEWGIDYSEIQYINNDAICRCGITILGVRKEAIASVPISIKSKSDNEMTRGMAADRLAAEGLKNASEVWGVGRYLDNQAFTVKYLWEHRHKIPTKLEEEVRSLSIKYGVNAMTDVTQSRKSTTPPPPPPKKQLVATPKSTSSSTTTSTTTPTTATVHIQDARVREIRTLLKYPTDLIVEWLSFQDAQRPSQLEPKVVDELVKHMCLSWASDKFDNSTDAAISYQQHVLSDVSIGVKEITAIQNWINYVMAPATIEAMPVSAQARK